MPVLKGRNSGGSERDRLLLMVAVTNGRTQGAPQIRVESLHGNNPLIYERILSDSVHDFMALWSIVG